MRLPPTAWPPFLGATIPLFCWLVLLWNLGPGAVWPHLRVLQQNPLYGVTADAEPPRTESALLDATWQAWFARHLAFETPIWRMSVKARNQLYYSGLNRSPVEGVLMGRGHELYESQYALEYCSRDRRRYEPEMRAAIPRLAAVQAFYRARSIPFLYVVTPSKVAELPDYLDKDYICPASVEDRTGKLVLWNRLLDEAGIDHIDTASLLGRMRAQYSIDLFPRSGTHWNALGVALAAQAVTEALNKVAARPLLTPFTFSWTVSHKPAGTDRDLQALLNLMKGDDDYPVPVLTYNPPRAFPSDTTRCRRTVLTAVGGSFMTGLALALERIGCPPATRLYYYWRREYLHPEVMPDRLASVPVEEGLRKHDLLSGDAVILEENELLVGKSAHGTAFEDFVAQQDKG